MGNHDHIFSVWPEVKKRREDREPITLWKYCNKHFSIFPSNELTASPVLELACTTIKSK